MPLSDQPLDVLLEEALQITDRHERHAWMRSVCGNDAEKLEDLMSLVEAAEKPSWIDSPLMEIQQGKSIFESIEGMQLGPFELMERIGTGGMGVVYLARQLEPVQRIVAIKLIQREFAGHQILERFQREQQTLANMDHPNIARIIDAGTSDSGFVYIVMEHVQGEQILDYCRQHQPSIRARIELMLQCCLAIQHAHQKGTIHRDIKPSNVLVTRVDGKPVVKVIDFGIAKAMAGETTSRMTETIHPTVHNFSKSLTQLGVSPGTPPYMSPEQYSAENKEVDTRSDIYSLGALLYALLTGLQPFDPVILGKMSFLDLKEFIKNHDPEVPSRRAPHLARYLRGDLDAIVLKAMSRNIDQRYQSAGLLMEDLRCYLVDAPVAANPGTALARTCKFAKRNKLLISASSLAIAGLLIGLVFSIIQERRAIVSEQQAKRQAYASDMLLTSMAIARGNYVLPQEILDRHRVGSLGVVAGVIHPNAQRLDWRLLAAQLPQEPELLARFPTKIYFGMDLPHRNEIACGCKDSHLRILDRTSGNIRLDIDTQQGEINGLALRPDGSEIACGGDDGTVRFYDTETGKATRQVKVSGTSVFQIAWTQNSRHFVTVGDEANAKVWTFPDFRLATTLDSVNESLECLGVSRQGKVAFGSDKGVIRIASFDSELPTKTQTVSAVMSRVFQVNRCSTVVFSPSGRILAVGLDNGYLLLMKDTGTAYQIVERVRFP
ncbi:MAG: protein kinase, partial [Planctomycetes bacterium]|nr:protein kinase [Planctomycetota bacterium]